MVVVATPPHSYQKLKDELLRRDHEQSELKIALDEARRQKELEAERTAKVELHYQKRLADLDHEMEAKLGAKDRQLSEQHGDFNNDKLDLERKVRRVAVPRSKSQKVAPFFLNCRLSLRAIVHRFTRGRAGLVLF